MKTMKGSIVDVAFLVVMFAVIGVGLIIVYHVISLSKTALSDAGMTGDPITMAEAGQTTVADFNTIFLFIYVGVNLATAVSAFMVRSHPVMFLVFFIVQVVAVFLSGQMATLYTSIISTPALSTDALLFGWITTVFANYGVLTLVFSIIVAIAMLAIPV